jgi:transposase
MPVVTDGFGSWKLTDDEWERFKELLASPELPRTRKGRPRLHEDRRAAEACLYRHFQAHQSVYRCFGWNQLPKELSVSASTANRRFREWSESGAWARFWHSLQESRHPVPADKWKTRRATGRFPVGDVIGELERAYLFFNDHLFESCLPLDVAISLERLRTKRCHGYFCTRVWTKGSRQVGHIALHTSVLGKGAMLPLGVLLHEMVHLRNHLYDIEDCHPRNQYHNRYFRDMAILAGLCCDERHPVLGYYHTEFDEHGRQVALELKPNDELFNWQAR